MKYLTFINSLYLFSRLTSISSFLLALQSYQNQSSAQFLNKNPIHVILDFQIKQDRY